MALSQPEATNASSPQERHLSSKRENIDDVSFIRAPIARVNF
jgi:hypothetical protein